MSTIKTLVPKQWTNVYGDWDAYTNNGTVDVGAVVNNSTGFITYVQDGSKTNPVYDTYINCYDTYADTYTLKMSMGELSSTGPFTIDTASSNTINVWYNNQDSSVPIDYEVRLYVGNGGYYRSLGNFTATANTNNYQTIGLAGVDAAAINQYGVDTTQIEVAIVPTQNGPGYSFLGFAAFSMDLTAQDAINNYAPTISNLTPIDGYLSQPGNIGFGALLTDQDTSDYLSLEVQYSQDGTFATGVVSVKSSSISSTSNVGVSASLSFTLGTPGVWYWRARAVDKGNLTSPWTTTRSLTVEYALSHIETTTADFSTGTLINTTASKNNLTLQDKLDGPMSNQMVEIIPSGLSTTDSYSNTSNGMPFNTFYQDNRFQYVLLASELTDAGLTSGQQVTSMALRSATVSGRDLANFRIRLQETASTTSSAFVTTGWTNVYGPTNVLKTSLAQDAWITFTFTTPFTWNGQNLYVDVSRDDTAYASGGGNWIYNATGRGGGMYSDSAYTWPYDTATFSQANQVLATKFNASIPAPDYYTSGSKTTAAIDISSTKFYKSSSLTWSYNGTGASTSISFQTSLDNGTTWQSISNGGSISGLVDSQDLTGKNVLVKANLSTTDTTVTPILNDFTLNVYGIDRVDPHGTANASATTIVNPYWYHIPVTFSGYANSIQSTGSASGKPTISYAAPIIGTRTPANNASVSSTSTTIYAQVTDPYGGASNVEFQVATDINFTSPTSYTFNGLASGAQTSANVTLAVANNYWRVRATNAKGVTSAWSAAYGLYYAVPNSRFSPIYMNQQTNLTGSLSAVQDDPDTPDANWLTATSKAQTILNVGFSAPPTTLLTGAGQQEFRALVRPSSAVSGGTVTIAVFDGSTQKAISTSYAIGTAATVLSFTWDASLLSSLTSGAVRIQITGNGIYSGQASKQYAIEVGAVEWNYKVTTTAQSNAPAGFTYLAYATGTNKSIVSAKASFKKPSGTLNAKATTTAAANVYTVNKQAYSNLRVSSSTNISATPTYTKSAYGNAIAHATTAAAPAWTVNSFYNDFSSYPSGAVPSDWTDAWVTASHSWAVTDAAGTSGGKVLQESSTVDGRRLLTWDKLGNISGDFDMILKWYSTDATSGNIPARIFAYASGNSTQTTQNGYQLDVLFPSTIRIGVTQAGAYSTLVSATNTIVMNANAWYWIRFRRIGTTMYGKLWADGSAEPSTFNINISDSKLTNGAIGIGSYDFDGTRQYDEFNIGINGATIPYPTTATSSGYGNLNSSSTVVANPYKSHPIADYIVYGDSHASATAIPRPWSSGMPVDHSASSNLTSSAVTSITPSQTRPAYSYSSATANAVVGTVTNFTPSDAATVLSYLADGLDGPTDANVLATVSQTVQPFVELKFPAVTGTLAGLQTIKITFVDPSYYGITIQVKENGSVVYQPPQPSYVQGAATHASFQFDASVLADKTGANASIKIVGTLYQSHTITSLNAVQMIYSLDAGIQNVPPSMNPLPVDNTLNVPTTIFPLNGAAWNAPVARAVVSSADSQPVKLRVKYSKTTDFASYYIQESDSFVSSGSEVTMNLAGYPFIDGDVIYWQAMSATATGQSVASDTFNYLYRPLGAFDTDRFMTQGNTSMMKIIDVSSFQGTVDWASIKSSGVDYAILRVYGSNVAADTNFVTNATNSKAAGVKTGGYYFAMPSVPLDLAQARSEADKFANQLQVGYGTGNYGDLLPVLDLEDNTPNAAAGQGIYNLSVADMLAWAQEFRTHFESTASIRLMMYTAESFVSSRNQFNTDQYTGDPKPGTTGNPLKDMPLWVAALTEYDRYRGFAMPVFGGWTEWKMWQYANKTHPTITGITGDLDQSITPTTMDWALTSNPDNIILPGKNGHGTFTAKATVSSAPTKTRTAIDHASHGMLNASAFVDGKPTQIRTAMDLITQSTLSAYANVVGNSTKSRTAADYVTHSDLIGLGSTVVNPTKTRTASDLTAQATLINATSTSVGNGAVSRTAADYVVHATVSGTTTAQDNANDTRTANDYLANAILSASVSVIANPQRTRTASDWTTHATLNDSSVVSGEPTKARTAADLSSKGTLTASANVGGKSTVTRTAPNWTANASLSAYGSVVGNPQQTRTASDLSSKGTLNASTIVDAKPSVIRTAADLTANSALNATTSVDGNPINTRTAFDITSRASTSAQGSIIANAQKIRTATDWTTKATLSDSSVMTGNPNVQRTANDLSSRATLRASGQVTPTPSKIRTAVDYQSYFTINANASADAESVNTTTAANLTSQGALSSTTSVDGKSTVQRTAADYGAHATITGTAITGSIPTVTRTAADYSTQAIFSGKATVTPAPQKTRTAADVIVYTHLNASANAGSVPTKTRTASDLSSQASLTAHAIADGTGSMNNTANIYSVHGALNGSARIGSMPNITRTAYDFQASSTITGSARVDGISQDNRTALDMSAKATLSGTSSATGRPNDTRTAQDFVSRSSDNAIGTVTKAGPSVTRTAADWTVKASLSAQASMDGKPTNIRTASDLQSHGTLSAHLTVVSNPVNSRTASDYSSHGTLSGNARVSSNPTDTRTANDYSARSLDTVVGTVAATSPNVSRTATDWSVKAVLSANVTIDGLPNLNNTASIWSGHGILSATSSVIANSTKTRTASDWTPKATLSAKGLVSPSPTKVRTANDLTTHATEGASGTVSAINPSSVRTAKDYSVYAKSITAKATVSSAPSKARTAVDLTSQGHMSSTMTVTITASPSRIRTAVDWISNAHVSGSASVGGIGRNQQTSTDYMAYAMNLTAKAIASSAPSVTHTATDFIIHAVLNGSASIEAKPFQQRTATDGNALINATARAIATSKPAVSRTATDLTTHATLTSSSTTIDGKPTKVRTASDWSSKSTSSASASAIGNGFKQRTAKDYAMQSHLVGTAAVGSAKPTQGFAAIYSVYGHVSANATVSPKPLNQVVSSVHASASITVSVKPTAQRTAHDWSVMGHLSASATTIVKPMSYRTAPSWISNGRLAASASIQITSAPTKQRTANDVVAQGSMFNASSTASAKPSASRTAHDYSMTVHLNAGATTVARPADSRTGNDWIAHSQLVVGTQIVVSASPSKIRTAKDLTANATLSAGDTIIGKPTVQRTAKDFTVYAHPNPGAVTDAKPTKIRTANDFSMHVTLKAGTTVIAVPTKLRTAKDVIVYAAMTGQAVVAVNPNHQRFEAIAYARIKPTTLVVANPKLLSIRNHVAIQRVQVGDGYVDVPIYALGAFPYDALRVMYGNGKIGCYELIEVDESTPLRIQTPHGVKGIKTLV